jgi:hypothetical protein
MSLIWEGDLADMMDILKLQAILENIHLWATRSLKPLLSTYIDQWKYRFLTKNTAVEDSETLSKILKKEKITPVDLSLLLRNVVKMALDMDPNHSATSSRDIYQRSVVEEICRAENDKLLSKFGSLVDVASNRDDHQRSLVEKICRAENDHLLSKIRSRDDHQRSLVEEICKTENEKLLSKLSERDDNQRSLIEKSCKAENDKLLSKIDSLVDAASNRDDPRRSLVEEICKA